jgi:tight adherence protein B
MNDLTVAASLGVPLLVGLGAGLMTFGMLRRRARHARTRRLAALVGMDPQGPGAVGVARQASKSLLQQLAQRMGHLLIVRQVAAKRIGTLTVIAGALTGLLSGQPMWYAPVLCAAAVMVWLHLHATTHRKLEQQAPAALEMLAAGLRAGFSVPQAIALVGRESPEPTGVEFAGVERELALGSTLADSLTHLADRTGLGDYRMVSTVIWIHAQVGGNLAVVLDSVVSTLRQRFDLREQVNALTSQQRMGSTVLAMLPVFVLLLLLLVDRPFVEPMFSQFAGRIMLGIAGVLLAAGWGTMRLLSRVEL